MRTILAVVVCLLSSLVFAGDMDRVLADVASSRQPVETTADGWRVRAVFVGQTPDGCSAVGLSNFDTLRVGNYRLCQDGIHRRDDMVPAYPMGRGGVQVLENVRRSALLYGQASQHWENYLLDARRVGPQGTARCGLVEVTASYDIDLIFNTVKEVCY